MCNAADLQSELRAIANPAKAVVLSGFFKTGIGQYGEGDQFIGINIPPLRSAVKKHIDMPLAQIDILLQSPIHEDRMAALFILAAQYKKASLADQSLIYEFYMNHTNRINSWDLVDCSADIIVGAHLADKDKAPLTALALSKSLWERRIAIISTFHYIKQGQADETLRIAETLLLDSEDLIHKAVGWMLREVGKRCSEEIEKQFLDVHAASMPRTMLRYSIERFAPTVRAHYLRAATGGFYSRIGEPI
jgi:3-methyladenine DNA glycosylase AlkD